MKYRRLGRSGLQVSEISLGTWQTFGMALDAADACRVVRRAFDLGVNLFDTADVYAKGRAEEVLGEALKELPREQVVVATKCMGRVWEGPLGAGLSRKHMTDALHGSLRRLQVEYVDLFQLHAPDPATPLEETLSTLDLFVRQGKVLYVGCSNFDPPLVREALDLCARRGLERFSSHQPLYNMLDRTAEESLLPLCGEEGLGVIVYSPLAEGLLTGKYGPGKPPPGSRGDLREPMRSRQLTERRLETVMALKAVAKGAGLPLSHLALGWLLYRPEVSSAIVGATRPEQVEENCGASGVSLPADIRHRISEVLAAPTPAPAA